MATRKYPNEIVRDEHDEDLYAKKVSVLSAATIYAQVNTGSSGNTTVEQGTTPWVTNLPSGSTVYQGTSPWDVAVLGNVTIDSGSVSLTGNVTIDSIAGALPAGNNNIGNVDIVSNTAWSDPNTYIGLATVDIGANNGVSFSGNVTLDAGSQTGIVGNVTIDSGTVTLGANSGVDIGDVDVTSNTAWSDPNTFIGLTTVTGSDLDIRSLNSTATLFAVVNAGSGGTSSTDDSAFTVGTDAGTPMMALHDNTSPDVVDEGDVGVPRMDTDRILFTSLHTIQNAWPDPNTFIGLATVEIGSNNAVSFSGNITVESITNALPAGDNNIGNVDVVSNTAWSDPNTFIGLATVEVAAIAAGNNNIGNVDIASAIPAGDNNIGNVDVVSNTAWSDPNTYIGLATVDIGSSVALTVDLGANNDVQGDVAHDSADANNPLKMGGRAQSPTANPDEVADNDRVDALFDRNGRLAIWDGVPFKSVDINDSTSGNNTIVAAVTGKKIRVLAVLIVSDGTVDVRWEDGAGGTALTGQVPLQAREGYAISNPYGLFETSSNTLLNLELSAAVNVHGFVRYQEIDD